MRGLPATIGLGCVARRFGQGKARGQRPGLSRSFQRHGVPARPHSRKFYRCLPSWSFRVAHLQTAGPHGAPRPYSQSPDRNGPRSGWHFEEEGRDNSASTSPSGHTPGVCVCGGGRCRLCCAGKGRRLSWPRRAVCFLLNDSLPLTWINRSRHELEGAVLIKTSKSRLWVRLREQEAQDATRARCSGRCRILQTEGCAQSTRSALHAMATSSHGAGLPACEPDWAADLPSHCPRRLVLSREKPPASKSQGTLLG